MCRGGGSAAALSPPLQPSSPADSSNIQQRRLCIVHLVLLWDALSSSSVLACRENRGELTVREGVRFCVDDAHCKEKPIYVLPDKKLRGLSPNFRIHVSVSDLYIPMTRPPIFLQENIGRPIIGRNL